MKRRLVQLVVFLIVGAIVNLLVAWGLALWSPASEVSRPSDTEMAAMRELLPPEWGLRPDPQMPNSFVGENGDRWIAIDTSKRGVGVSLQSVGAQWHPIASGIPMLVFPLQVHVLRAGWPVLSLQCRGGFEYRSPSWIQEWSGALAASRLQPQSVALSIWAGGSYERHLPVKPLWFGFLVNTLLYAALAWLLVATPLRLRRGRRLRRGQCPRCAYPIGVSPVCTECGKPLPAPLVRAGES